MNSEELNQKYQTWVNDVVKSVSPSNPNSSQIIRNELEKGQELRNTARGHASRNTRTINDSAFLANTSYILLKSCYADTSNDLKIEETLDHLRADLESKFSDEYYSSGFGAVVANNLGLYYFYRASVAENSGDIDKMITLYQHALKCFTQATNLCGDNDEIELSARVAISGDVGQDNPSQIFVKPFRHHSTALIELAQRLEDHRPDQKDPTQSLRRSADSILENGMDYMARKGQTNTPAYMNLAISQIVTAAMHPDVSALKTEDLSQYAGKFIVDINKMAELPKVKKTEWIMVLLCARSLCLDETDDKVMADCTRNEIMDWGKELGVLKEAVPDYIRINGIYKKAMGDRFLELTHSIEMGAKQAKSTTANLKLKH